MKIKGPQKTDAPTTRDYPALHAWLQKHDARCQWELDHNKGETNAFKVISFHFPASGHHVLVQVHHRMGWNLYTAFTGNSVSDSLEDAERRLGLEPNP